jgi:hypothetical protein
MCIPFRQIDETLVDSSQLGMALNHATPHKVYQAHNQKIAGIDQHSLVSSSYLLGLR